MPPITSSANHMPALCAACGSFLVKSSSASLVTPFMIVRVCPFFLTVTLNSSCTFMVSSLRVRSVNRPEVLVDAWFRSSILGTKGFGALSSHMKGANLATNVVGPASLGCRIGLVLSLADAMNGRFHR